MAPLPTRGNAAAAADADEAQQHVALPLSPMPMRAPPMLLMCRGNTVSDTAAAFTPNRVPCMLFNP
jgi:hypothetical protein